VKKNHLPERIIIKKKLVEKSMTAGGICKNLDALLQEMRNINSNDQSKEFILKFKKTEKKYIDQVAFRMLNKKSIYEWIQQCFSIFNEISKKNNGIGKSLLIEAENILRGRILPLTIPFPFCGLDKLNFERIAFYDILLEKISEIIKLFASWGVFQGLEYLAEFEIKTENRKLDGNYDFMPYAKKSTDIYPKSKQGKKLAEKLCHGFIKAKLLINDPRYTLPKICIIEFGKIRHLKPFPDCVHKARQFEDLKLRLQMQDTQPEALLNDLFFFALMGDIIEENVMTNTLSLTPSFEEVDFSRQRTLIEVDELYESQFLKFFTKRVDNPKNFNVLRVLIIEKLERFFYHLLDSSESVGPGFVRSQNSKDDDQFAYSVLMSYVEEMSLKNREKFTTKMAVQFVDERACKEGRVPNKNAVKRASKKIRKELGWRTKSGPKLK